jgi:RNA polymerase sigma factor (sigma-70 family)
MAQGRGEPQGKAVSRYLKPLREYVGRRVRFFVETEGLDPTQLVAEDFVNETLATALRRRGREGGAISVAWLRQVARGLIGREVERLVKARAREVSLDTPVTGLGPLASVYPEEDLTLADLLPDTALPLPAEVYEQGELWECVDRTFAALPEPWREIFFLHAVDGYTMDEVASLQGRPVEAIIHSVSQTREHLREALEDEFGELLEAA